MNNANINNFLNIINSHTIICNSSFQNLSVSSFIVINGGLDSSFIGTNITIFESLFENNSILFKGENKLILIITMNLINNVNVMITFFACYTSVIIFEESMNFINNTISKTEN